jgi:hypothetical protein
MSDFFAWLFSESGIAWIVAIFSLGGWIIYWRRHEKPISMVIQEIENIELLNIHPSQKDNLLIQYNDETSSYPIQNLVQKKVILYNIGSVDITEPIEFSLFFSSAIKNQNKLNNFAKVVSERNECKSFIKHDTVTNKDEIVITVNYLNSTKRHQHFITLYILTENFIELLSKPVVGKGWSVYIFEKNRLSKIKPISKTLYYIFVAGVLLPFFNPGMSFIDGIAKWIGFIFNLKSEPEMDPVLSFIYAVLFFGALWIVTIIINRYEKTGINFISNKIVAPILDYPPPDVTGDL